MATNTAATLYRPAVVMAQDTITRLANTTAYAAADAISDDETTPTVAGYFTLPLAGRPGGGGTIIGAALTKDDTDLVNANFDVLLFDTALAATSYDDNNPFSPTAAELLLYQGTLEFTTSELKPVANGDVGSISVNVPFVCTAAEINLYGFLVARGAYTPASGEVFSLSVFALQD